MRRRLLTVAIFLLAGAVVNVGVAWGCAAWMEVGGGGYDDAYIAPVDRYWGVEWSERWGFSRVMSWSSPAAGDSRLYASSRPRLPTWAGIQMPDASINPSIETWQISDAFGWPYLAMAARFSAELSGDPPQIVKSALDGILLTAFDPVTEDGRGLPLRPIWPGFAFDTIFYAAFFWLVICGPLALRRELRVRRGLCPACGYDLRHGEHEACPECGLAA